MNAAMMTGFGKVGAAMTESTSGSWGVFVKVTVGKITIESCKMFDVSEARAKDSAKFYKEGYARQMRPS